MKTIQFISAFRKHLIMLYILLVIPGMMIAQTNPAPQQIPYTQDFGNNWFKPANLPAGFAIWTASAAPRTSNTSAASSTPVGDDINLDSATVVKATGQSYGYSGISGGTAINNGEVYIQTSGSANGTNQLVMALNTTGYSNITISFDVEMINPQPKFTGFALQFRVGTSGAFTTIDSSYWHSSADRIQNQVDYFVNVPFPSAADDQSVIEVRWATSRGTAPSGGSCGLGFDNIVVSGIKTGTPLYFRSAASGNWNSISSWESSSDNITWSPATTIPNSGDNEITIRAPHIIKTTGINNLVIDQVTIDSGATLWNAYNTILGINDGPGAVDLDIFGTFCDSSNYSVVWPNTSRWRIAPNANFIKTTNTSSTNWQLKYYTGIINIPSTSNWICRKPVGAAVEPSISTTNGGPPYPQVYYGNLYIENYASTWNSNNLCKFSGNINYPIIKGNMYVGGNGTTPLNFVNSNTNASPVKVMGNVIIKAGNTFSVTGTGLEVQGNFISNGVYTHASSTSRLLFSGSIDQDVSGTGTISTYIFELNKPGGQTTVNNNMNVFGNLKLVSGIVYTTPSAKIIVEDNATTTNASDISFISGPIQKKGNDAFLFPVGKGNNYQPVGMNVGSGAQVTDAFTAEYFYVNPVTVYGNNLGPGLQHISHCEYWILDKDAGNSQKNVTLTWDGNSCGVTVLSDLRVARFNTIQWVDEGNSGTTGSVGGGTVTSNVTTGYGPFTLASVNTENPLPVSLLNFNARYNGKEVKLTWVTASEINNQYFTVERSKDGTHFETVFTQPGAGNSTELLSYYGLDSKPMNGISYYRLKQTDFDGTSTWTDLVPVRIKDESIVIGPIETSRSNSSIEFDLSFPYNSTAKIEITDVNGRLISMSTFSIVPETRHFTIDASRLKGGMYYMRVYCGDEMFLRKFIY